MSNKINYVKSGKCIWCGRELQEAVFKRKPHILPDSLGGQEIGFDICDDCNFYFGKAPKAGVPGINHAFKEVFGAYRMFSKDLNSESYKKFSSQYFSYFHKDHLIKVRRNFNSKAVTRQFKRGLYEVFLQKYHYVTGDGNNPMFKMVRDFARFDIGNPHVYYEFNNIILTPGDEEMTHPILHMSDKLLDDMMKYGLFNFWLMGHNFYMEIIPLLANVYTSQYLQRNHSLINVNGDESIYEFTDISQIDFFMQRFNS